MRVTRGLIAAAALMPAAATIVGCGSQSGDYHDRAPTSQQAPAALATPTFISELGLHLEPPPADAHPDISAEAAVGRCSVDTPCPTRSPDAVELALVTSDAGATINGVTTNLTPVIDHRLSWLLRWNVSPCAPTGGLPLPTQTTTATISESVTTCLQIDVIDAATGFFLTGASTSTR